MSPATSLEAVAVTKRYGHVKALRGVDLSLSPGSCLALFGPNGAGKSTLLRVLSGLTRPDGGDVLLSGERVQDAPNLLRRRLGHVSHATMLHDALSPRENLTFAGRLHGLSSLKERVAEVLEVLGLSARADEAVGTLSRGLQQRVAVARALVHDPDLLLLDEPFTGLDQEAARALSRLLRTLSHRGRSMVLVTHDLERGLEHADRLAILDRGRLVHEGPAEGTDRATLVELYAARVGEAA